MKTFLFSSFVVSFILDLENCVSFHFLFTVSRKLFFVLFGDTLFTLLNFHIAISVKSYTFVDVGTFLFHLPFIARTYLPFLMYLFRFKCFSFFVFVIYYSANKTDTCACTHIHTHTHIYIYNYNYIPILH